MKKVFILAALCLMGQSSWAQIRDFQTTRLNSTAGTGVASVLSTEAALLNPAMAAFFDKSSASFQNISTVLKHKNDLRDANNDGFQKHNRSQGLFLADHSGQVKGGLAYLTQNENNYKREQLILHGAAPIGPNASMGVSYRYVQDKRPQSYPKSHDVFHQLTWGTTYIVDEDTILGLVVIDPTRANTGDERLLGGFQYQVAEKFIIMGDAGAQYTKAFSKKYLWRGAAQINIFSDFFFRIGKFYDNVTEFKGTGWGVSWIGPNLGVEFAQKYSDAIGSNRYIYKNETLVDTSLSALIKF